MSALVMVAAACAPSGGETHVAGREATLRISTHFGITAVSPQQLSTISSHLLDLVYVPLGSQFERLDRDAARIILTRRAASALDAATLARAMRAPGLVGVSAEGARVVVVFSDVASASLVSLDSYLLELGPYAMGELSSETLTLRRKGAGPWAETIAVTTMATEEEEWRRFLAGEVDVVPITSPSHLRYLREVPSVRIALVAHSATAAMFFQVRAGSRLADASLRRAISLALRRRPLAATVVEDADAAVETVEDLDGARRLRKGGPEMQVRLLVHEPSSDSQRAALVIQQQLTAIGISVSIRALGNELFIRALVEGDFDLALHYGGFEPRHWYLMQCGSPGNVIGYCNPDFDAAVAANDEARAAAILARDLPLTPLYRMNEGVALDGSLCGARPQVMYDLSWLADVRPCAPGEVQ